MPTNTPYKVALQQRLNELVETTEGTEWERTFIRSVSRQAFAEGVLALSPKQIAMIEKLHEKLVD